MRLPGIIWVEEAARGETWRAVVVAFPVVIVALFIAAYWGWQLIRTRDVPDDWRYPQSVSERPSPISLTPAQFRLVAGAGIAASLAVAAYALVALG